MTRLREYEGDEAIRHRLRRGLVALGALCAGVGLASAVTQAAGGPQWLDLLANGLAIVALLLAGRSLRLRSTLD